MNSKFSVIAATAAALTLSGAAYAQSSDGTDINDDAVNQTDDVETGTGGTSASNGLDTNTDINSDAVRQTRDTETGLIIEGATLDTNLDVNGNPVRANRTDVGGMGVSYVRSTELSDQNMVNAMNNSNVTSLQANIRRNASLTAQIEAAGYSVDDVVATYWEDDSFYVIVR